METEFHQEFYCPTCKEWVRKDQFNNHKMSHWNDPLPYPATFEQLKQRFEAIGFYNER